MPVFTSSIEVTADYPTIKPSLNLNFARSRSLDPRVGFERASVGTYVGRDGLIKTAGVDEARFDHDPETLESLGLLIEQSRTNIVHGNPGQSNIVVTSGQANSLTGNNDAYKLAKNSPSSNSQSHGSWGVTGNVSTTSYVMSIFVKKINHSKFFMQTVAQSADNLYVYIDIDTGVTSHTDYTASGNLTVTTSIETYTDGWYRIISRVQGFAANTLASGFRFGFGDPSSGAQQYTNNDDEVLVYGAQIEDGSFATSYIPSADSSSSVTRAADYATITGESFNSFFNPYESTLYASVVSNGTTNGGIVGIDRSDGITYINPIYIGSTITFYGSGGPGNKPRSGDGRDKLIQTWNDTGDTQSFTANGATPSSYTFTSSIAPDKLSIGRYSYGGGNFFNGIVSEVRYYTKALPNAQLQLLTS